jgi:adenylate cyclase
LSARRITRDVIAATAIALACAGIAVSPVLDRIHGLSLDILTALRFEMFGIGRQPRRQWWSQSTRRATAPRP